MASLKAHGILAAFALSAVACGSSHAVTPVASSPATTTTAASPQAAAANPVESTALTSAQVPASATPAAPVAQPSTPTPPPAAIASRWTDAEIVAALDAAHGAREREAKEARARSNSARVERYLQDMVLDDRDLLRSETQLARSVGSTPSALRTQVEEARTTALRATRDSGTGFDRDFITAEIKYERSFLRVLEDEMIPSAKAPELKQLLQTLRAKTLNRILAAEQVETNIR